MTICVQVESRGVLRPETASASANAFGSQGASTPTQNALVKGQSPKKVNTPPFGACGVVKFVNHWPSDLADAAPAISAQSSVENMISPAAINLQIGLRDAFVFEA